MANLSISLVYSQEKYSENYNYLFTCQDSTTKKGKICFFEKCKILLDRLIEFAYPEEFLYISISLSSPYIYIKEKILVSNKSYSTVGSNSLIRARATSSRNNKRLKFLKKVQEVISTGEAL